MTRIAIVGNMNNSGFALLRYFRDLGADAWLLPYASDGAGNLAHFAPAADTWELPRWQGWIRPLGLPNTTAALLGSGLLPRSGALRRSVEPVLAAYDSHVGSGIAPALFHRLGRRLDIYFPYATGIEFYGDFEFMSRMRSSPARQLVYRWLRRQQACGIREARHCLNAEMSLTRDAFAEIGRAFEPLAIPAVYNREAVAAPPLPDRLQTAVGRLRSAGLALFCCARQLWVRDPRFDDATWSRFTKHSDWLFQGLSRFVQACPEAGALLAVVEYGPDAEASKRLVAELGLQDHVLWLPTMQRREIMQLLAAAHVGVGEFYQDPGVIWGGTGWEVLACGRPLLQSFNFSAESYAAAFGHRPPPILDVKSPDDIARHLLACWRDQRQAEALGRASRSWFDEHNGIGLARRWLHRLQPAVTEHAA